MASLSDSDMKDQLKGVAVAASLIIVVAVGLGLIVRSFFR